MGFKRPWRKLKNWIYSSSVEEAQEWILKDRACIKNGWKSGSTEDITLNFYWQYVALRLKK